MHQVSARKLGLRALAALAVVGPGGCSESQPLTTGPRSETPSFLVVAGSGTWATKAPMPTARNNIALGEANGILYAIGGSVNTPGVAANEAYDPTTNSWATKAPLPTPRNFQGTNGAVVNGIVYVIGGNPPGYCTSANEAYDPATDTWTTKAPMPTPRCHLAVGALNGLIYAVGGTPTSGSPKYSILEVYNPATDTWTTGASMPTGRQGLGFGAVNGVLYAVGGSNGLPGGDLDVVEAYTPATDSWTTKAPMSTVRSGPGIGEMNGLLYAIGGVVGGTAFLATVEVYDPSTNTWTSQAPMPTARGFLGSGVANGVLYAVGGYNGSGVLATNEAFTPTPAYPFTGFFQPVDNPDIVNVAKAGSAVPVKFSLGSNLGLNILSPGSPSSTPYTCGSAPTDVIEQTVAATTSGLQYDPTTNQYTYVWKTDKSWAGTCRKFSLGLTDGSTHVALFQFK